MPKTRPDGSPLIGPRYGRERLAVGDRQRARAEREFLRALNDLLPGAAFTALTETAPAEVSAWADQLHIYCPCVLQAARSLASLAQVWRDDGGGVIPPHLRSLLRTFGESYSEPIPDVWFEELARLDRLPPTTPSAWPAITSDEARQQPEVLAPIVTDGRESLEALLQRVLDFWSGRRARFLTCLREAGLCASLVRPMPEIARDARWVVRVRVRDERPAQIAKDAGVETRQVETAVRRLEQRLQLKPMRRRGRPPRRAP